MALPSRRTFFHDGREVYQWEQGLDEVLVYITPPPGVRAAQLDCTISSSRVRLGLRGVSPFLDAELSSRVVVSESTWTLGLPIIADDGVLTLTLTKAHKAETWPAVFKGHGELDAAGTADAHKQMLLERFQAENPGFDFSGAEVNGSVPDPRLFMGGPR